MSPADGFQGWGYFGVGHEHSPAEGGSMVFDHDYYRSLIDGEVTFGEPVLVEIEAVGEAELAPESLAVCMIEMP